MPSTPPALNHLQYICKHGEGLGLRNFIWLNYAVGTQFLVTLLYNYWPICLSISIPSVYLSIYQ